MPRIIPLFGGLMLVVGTMLILRKNAEGDPDVRLNLSTARVMLPWILSLGFVAGGLAGFFGIGGGFLIVPALMLATGMPITYAIATSLVPITAFGLVTSASYALAGEVVWRTVALFVGGGLAGGVVGQLSSSRLAQHKSLLQTAFAASVIIGGLYMLIRGKPLRRNDLFRFVRYFCILTCAKDTLLLPIKDRNTDLFCRLLSSAWNRWRLR